MKRIWALAPLVLINMNLENVHPMDPQGLIYRGSEPGTKVQELKNLGIQSVLIIKNDLHAEVQKEQAALRDLGIASQQIPIEWNHPELHRLCFQIAEAVQTLENQKRQGRKTYFHCTKGEDRTGVVAGLFRMVDQGWTWQRAFRDEMCRNGYSDGDRGKPRQVVTAIEAGLTPVFLTLVRGVSAGAINPAVCGRILQPARIPTCSLLPASE